MAFGINWRSWNISPISKAGTNLFFIVLAEVLFLNRADQIELLHEYKLIKQSKKCDKKLCKTLAEC
jgi:hypothetical protein